MFRFIYNFFYLDPIQVKRKGSLITIDGLDVKKFLRDIHVITHGSRIASIVFDEVNDVVLTFDRKFLVEVRTMFLQIIEHRRKCTSNHQQMVGIVDQLNRVSRRK